MIYYRCNQCGSTLSRFDGGHRSTKCPKCGAMAPSTHVYYASGSPTDFHRPMGGTWREGSSRQIARRNRR